MRRTLPRLMWSLLEPIHALVYFAPETGDALRDLGMKGWWMGYFAGRAGPLGAVGPKVVTATFYNFRPEMVERAIPDAWRYATPGSVLDARLVAMDAALRRVLGDEAVESQELALAARLARVAVDGCEVTGRPLFAGHAQLPWPDEPHMVLWHAATLLREHRGDGHVAALLTSGLDGCEALITMTATGTIPRPLMQQARGWTDEEWSSAEDRLRDRHWLDPASQLTEDGRAGREEIEHLTDALAASPWRALGTETCSQLAALLEPITDRVFEAGAVPVPNPIGISRRSS